jgi:hypothetical protein
VNGLPDAISQTWTVGASGEVLVELGPREAVVLVAR